MGVSYKAFHELLMTTASVAFLMTGCFYVQILKENLVPYKLLTTRTNTLKNSGISLKNKSKWYYYFDKEVLQKYTHMYNKCNLIFSRTNLLRLYFLCNYIFGTFRKVYCIRKYLNAL